MKKQRCFRGILREIVFWPGFGMWSKLPTVYTWVPAHWCFFNFEKNWIPQCLMGHLTVMTKTSNALTMQCVAPNTVQPGLALPNRKQHEDKIRQVHGFLAHLGPDALWLRGFQGMISPIFSRLESEKKLKKWIHHLERIDGATPISLGFIMAPKTNLPLRG